MIAELLRTFDISAFHYKFEWYQQLFFTSKPQKNFRGCYNMWLGVLKSKKWA